ncbi:pimeloyl-ACP methyl ester carboxylesterase [Microbacteriaceae bacterium SG_E_30_P1]|uniref:Pimeloyl-ACP methyl ester carboxylesterase n=1 Tax=Antiquaquibacter oligotrophicus TaxID=2880260 RepID=A0ABT6KMC4_9MICO|nr:alpha/beta hydrolase [Antiquaquibacter oligotrophicus]MDH6181161.1 pimeloyl-ACP methyl ester carboxylesterase [Antiquaquibacter oligotrophicus]UDF13143.1 alpha/beta hydrolase [Antiquaquibacter oligotrophicus]
MPQSVVLVHGLRTSATMWRRQVELLESLGHEAIAVDLPGHGSRMRERFTLDGAVQTVADAVARAEHPPLLCGFSLGGYTSIHYLGGAESSRAKGLLAASCGTRPYRAVLGAWRAAARVIHAFPDRGLGLNNWAVRAAVRDPELADDVIRGGVALEVMDDALREVAALDPVTSLRRIRVPVWLVNGTLDHFRLEERRYAAAAPDARLLHVRGATHMVSLTRPDDFDRILLDVLDSLPA